MLQNIIRVIFIVLFAIVLAGSVIFAIVSFKGDNILNLLLSILIAALSIYRIAYYAQGFGNKHEE
mgnify:CR=1 FL=1